jgi:hypothetical protein
LTLASVIASELHVVCMNVSFVHPNAIGVCLSSSFNDVVIIDINAIGCRPAARQRAQCNQLQQEKHSGSTAPPFAYGGLYLADPTGKSVRATPLARSRPFSGMQQPENQPTTPNGSRAAFAFWARLLPPFPDILGIWCNGGL